MKLVDETELASGEDAPMSMAAHPEVHSIFSSPLEILHGSYASERRGKWYVA